MDRDLGNIMFQSPVTVPFRGEVRTTTLGRLFFNEILPEDSPFQNEEMTKKRLQGVLWLKFSLVMGRKKLLVSQMI
jgi:DNA-directed RNA polymerase subunit beta'